MSQQQDAEALLSQVEGVQRKTREDANPVWFPLILFGILSLASAPFGFIEDGKGLGFFWIIAGPAGSALTGWYMTRHDRRLGLHKPGWAQLITAAALIITAFAVVDEGIGHDSEVLTATGPFFVVAAAYAVFAWLSRSALVARLSATMLLIAIVLSLWLPNGAEVIGSALLGVATLASGVHDYRRRNSR